MTDKTIQNSTWGGPIKLVDLGDETYGVAAALSGMDIEDGSQKNGVSFEIDENGYNVLRVIQAALYGYDATLEAQNVRVKGNPKLERYKLTVTVPASGTENVYQSGVTPTFDRFDASEYKSIVWGVKPEASHTFDLKTITLDYTDNIGLNRPDRTSSPYVETFTSASSGQTKPIEITTDGLMLQIVNKDTGSAHTYTCYVYLRR